jgi:hypothetical protein
MDHAGRKRPLKSQGISDRDRELPRAKAMGVAERDGRRLERSARIELQESEIAAGIPIANLGLE